MQAPYVTYMTYMFAPWCCWNPLPPLCSAGLLALFFIMNLNMTCMITLLLLARPLLGLLRSIDGAMARHTGGGGRGLALCLMGLRPWLTDAVRPLQVSQLAIKWTGILLCDQKDVTLSCIKYCNCVMLVVASHAAMLV